MNEYLYDWDFCGFGGTLTRLSDEASIWMQGEEANQFDDDWENCEDAHQANLLASAYDDVMEFPS